MCNEIGRGFYMESFYIFLVLFGCVLEVVELGVIILVMKWSGELDLGEELMLI